MIINSLLDTDFYKFTQQQAVFYLYTDVNVRYKFKWRNWHKMNFKIDLEEFVEKVNKEIDHLCTLRFKEDELEYLSNIPFFKNGYIEYLRIFQLNRKHVKVGVDKKGELSIKIEGPWLNIILFETPILAIISELYTVQVRGYIDYTSAAENFEKKIDFLYKSSEGFKFGDFGTRRRISFEFQNYMINYLVAVDAGKYLAGTSNVYFAKKYNIKPLGTQAHEWYQVHQQLGTKLADSQSNALQKWADVYRGDLGIALSDCITFDAFLVDFDKYFAKLYDGCRHDSGDPYVWANKLISHYENLGIDPKTKTALFSDGLNLELAEDLYNTYNKEINVAFGIGTYLTNDTDDFVAPQIVLKVVETNGKPVAKVSDSPGKGMCEDVEFENYLKKVILQKIGNGV